LSPSMICAIVLLVSCHKISRGLSGSLLQIQNGQFRSQMEIW
jgi:hypothetical protein